MRSPNLDLVRSIFAAWVRGAIAATPRAIGHNSERLLLDELPLLARGTAVDFDGRGGRSCVHVEVYRGPVTTRTDPRVDAYLAALPEWQQVICREVRALLHSADPQITETIKRGNRPYFVLEGNVCALLAAKDHVNVFLYDGGIVADPEGIITSGHENKTARTVAIRRGEAINARALRNIFQAIIANNRAGGWRKLKSGA